MQSSAPGLCLRSRVLVQNKHQPRLNQTQQQAEDVGAMAIHHLSWDGCWGEEGKEMRADKKEKPVVLSEFIFISRLCLSLWTEWITWRASCLLLWMNYALHLPHAHTEPRRYRETSQSLQSSLTTFPLLESINMPRCFNSQHSGTQVHTGVPVSELCVMTSHTI